MLRVGAWATRGKSYFCIWCSPGDTSSPRRVCSPVLQGLLWLLSEMALLSHSSLSCLGGRRSSPLVSHAVQVAVNPLLYFAELPLAFRWWCLYCPCLESANLSLAFNPNLGNFFPLMVSFPRKESQLIELFISSFFVQERSSEHEQAQSQTWGNYCLCRFLRCSTQPGRASSQGHSNGCGGAAIPESSTVSEMLESPASHRPGGRTVQPDQTQRRLFHDGVARFQMFLTVCLSFDAKF